MDYWDNVTAADIINRIFDDPRYSSMSSEAQEEEEPSTTVKFNVGGKLYEVSKSLLEGFPGTILAEKASSSSSSPIFIDRDPDRFAFCLDYMRDNGKVHLPETVSKLAFLEELKFFGFVDVDETNINDEKSNQNCIERFRQLKGATKRRIEKLEKEAQALENDHKRKKKEIGMEIERMERDLDRRKNEIKLEKLALKCDVASLENISKASFRVNYKQGLRNVHRSQYFIECCDKLALCVVDDGSGDSVVCLRRKTNSKKLVCLRRKTNSKK